MRVVDFGLLCGLLAFGNFPGAAFALELEENATSREAQKIGLGRIKQEEGTPSFLRSGKTALSDQAQMSLLQVASKVPADIGSVAIAERVQVAESLAEELDKVIENQLKGIDLSEHPHFADAIGLAIESAETSKVSIADAIHHMKAASNPVGRRAQEVEVEAGGNAKTHHGHSKKKQSKSWHHHYKPKGNLKQHFNTPKHQHAQKIQHAVLGGNHNFLSGVVDGLHASTSHFGRQSNRKLQAQKPDHCLQLASCAKRMSLYDLLVFYLSDDIDPLTGKIDENIISYEELKFPSNPNVHLNGPKQGLQWRHDQIQSLVGQLFYQGWDFDNDSCDRLLKLFYRNIEVDGNPQWEGAIVSEVCLAEGTTVPVDMGDAIRVLAQNYKVSDDPHHVLAYGAELLEILQPFVAEVTGCAFDLHRFLAQRLNPVSQETTPFELDDGRFDRNNKELIAWPIGVNQGARDQTNGRWMNTDKPFIKKDLGKIVDEFLNCIFEETSGDSAEEAGSYLNNTLECVRDFGFHHSAETYLENEGLAPVYFQALFFCQSYYQSEIIKECIVDYGETIQQSINVVFGDKASVGLVCGVKEAVVNDGRDMPGDCCLNAPFEGIQDRWGYKYDCKGTCEHGPLLSGLSEATCSVYGGTFCPIADCTDLRNCVQDEISFAESNNLPTYHEYLKNSPNISNPLDDKICGRARQYFGFQSNFIDDSTTCEDIQQFRFSEDFDFLDEFFNQGDKIGPGPGDGNCLGGGDPQVECVPDVVLTPEDRSTSETTPVTNGQAWSATNFALSKAVSTNTFAIEIGVEKIECPCDPLCILDNICAGVKTVLGTALTIVKFILELILDISEYTLGEVAEISSVDLYRALENTNAIFGNMDTTGKWLKDRMEYLYFETTCRSVEELLPGHGCDGLVNLCGDGERVADKCFEDIYDPVIELTRVTEMCGPDSKVFPDALKAVECVKNHVIASDDCYRVDVEVAVGTGSLPATCGMLQTISITATEQRCGKSTSTTFDVLVDSATSAYCTFSQSPDTPPSLDISAAIDRCSGHTNELNPGHIFFQDIDVALTCIRAHTSYNDDCRSVELTVSANTGEPIPASCQTLAHVVDVTATISGCTLNTTKSMIVLVDSNIPTRTCSFTQGPEIDPVLDISAAIDQCGGKFFATQADAEACLMDNTVATDGAGGCRQLDLSVASVSSQAIPDSCQTFSYLVEVTATIDGCTLSTTKSMSLLVDASIATKTCSFPQGTEIDPVMDTSAAVDQCSNKFFSSIAEAEACVLDNTVASDGAGDCRGVDLAVSSVSSLPTPSSCGTLAQTVEVTATVSACLVTTKSLSLWVDPNISSKTCAFPEGTELNPVLDISAAVDQCRNKFFATIADAEACVVDNTVASDGAGGCRPVTVTPNTVLQSGPGCRHEVKVTAEVVGCDPSQEDLETVSMGIPVQIDGTPPEVACSIDVQNLKGKDKDEYKDVGFEYSASDTCSETLAVEILVESDELENGESAITSNGVTPFLYVRDKYCDGHSGKDFDSCKIPSLPKTKARYYKVTVSVTDEAGYTSSGSCDTSIQEKNKEEPNKTPLWTVHTHSFTVEEGSVAYD